MRSKSIPHAGKHKVHQNLKTLNRFSIFFQTTQESSRYFFLIQLAKFFDTDAKQRTLTLKRLIKNIEDNFDHLTKENFFKYRKKVNSPVVDGLKDLFKPVSRRDIAGWKRSLRAAKKVTDKLIKYRNQVLAHDDDNKVILPISRDEVFKLFKTISSVLNKISNRIEWSKTMYDNAKISSRQTKLVIDYLTKYDKVRIRELERKWKVKL